MSCTRFSWTAFVRGKTGTMMCGMNKIEDRKADDGAVVSEGVRSPSTLFPGQGRPGTTEGSAIGPLGPGQRWSAGRKRAVVLRLLAGDSVELLSRELGLPVFRLEQWRQKAEAALDGALRRCTRINPLLRLGLGDDPPRDDGDHRNPDVPGKEICSAVVDDVEAPVAAEPSEQPLDDPPDPVRQGSGHCHEPRPACRRARPRHGCPARALPRRRARP